MWRSIVLTGWFFMVLQGPALAFQPADSLPVHYFRNISVGEGLSQSTVFSIARDTLGFMWMGTHDGLNRYDGEAFRIYRPRRNDPGSLQSNHIRVVFLDREGQLWIGGNKGVSRYDYTADRFHNYQLPRRSGEWYISSLTQDAAGTIWAASTGGEIFQFEPAGGTFEKLNFDATGHDIRSIRALLQTAKGLYLGTDIGLYRLNVRTKELEALELGADGITINDLLLDGQTLWIGTEGAGLFGYSLENGEVKHYLHEAAAEHSLADNDVRSVEKDAEGNLWVGTFRGLSILNLRHGLFQNYHHWASIPYTISQNSIRCVYRDTLGGMWLGTYYGGVSYYHPNDIKFSLLSQNSGPLSLSDQVVNVIRQDAAGNFWIGTNDKGLNYWDRRAGKMRYYVHDELHPESISSNNIKAILFDRQGKMLVGTHNAGLNYFDPVSGKSKVYRHTASDPESIAGDMVYALLKDSRDRIWVGTRSGLDRFDPEKEVFTHTYIDGAGNRLTSDEITYLMEDRRQRIWIGTNKGVNIFYPDRKLFEPFPSILDDGGLSDDIVTCIAEDVYGRVWVGTRNGLNLFDETTRTFTIYTTAEGLPNNVVYGILPGKDGTLWISTNKGLVNFDPQQQRTRVFDSRDGLQSNQFNLYAFCLAEDGMMLFGGINGISYFYPEDFRRQPLDLKVTFTGLDVFNQPVLAGGKNGTLDTHIDQAEQLHFSSEQRQFAISFNAFNYVSPGKVGYLYRMVGYDEDWVRAERAPRASYSNLPPGKYVFEVKALGPSGESSPVRSIRVRIHPPWWNTTWFYLLVFLAAGGGIYFAYRILWERYRTLHQLKMERMEREKTDYINNMKMEFFTNVSHEFRTPLTLIMAPLEELLARPAGDKPLRRQLEFIMLNARRLLFLVDQLMEFRKTELGTLRLKVKKGDIVSFLHELYRSFAPLSNRHHVRYTFTSTEAKLSLNFDRDCIEKICFNLLSNAFKFTPDGGSVELRLSRTDKHAVIAVTDSGIGIDKKHQDKVFDRFYRVNNGEVRPGSGVGLALTKRLVEQHHGQIRVESESEKGASFIVTIPLEDSSYRPEEFLQEPVVAFQDEIRLPGDDTGVPDVEELVGAAESREKMLIVDDNTEILDYLNERFSLHYEVITAQNGLQALELLEDREADIIVCDVMMPGLDGTGLCRKLKQNIKTCHIPIVLLTARNELDQQIEGLEAGADDYVTKPFSISLLEAKVQNIVRSRKRLKEHYSNSREIVPENIAFNPLDEEFLREALRIVEENITESDFSVDDFSRKIGMSRSNLYLKLKAITGESATDFIRRIRFKKAAELLRTRRYTVAQVAYMSGFNAPSYFSTSFKQYYGCLPTEFLSQSDPDS